jgi:hypothetical protein
MAKDLRSRFLPSLAFVLAVAATPALAQEPANNLGPVGPGDPILANFGGQRVIAFFAPESGHCAVSAVTWKDSESSAPYASTRIRVTLKPGQTLSLDGAERQSMGLLCGVDASTLAAVAPAELILTGATQKD